MTFHMGIRIYIYIYIYIYTYILEDVRITFYFGTFELLTEITFEKRLFLVTFVHNSTW